MVDRDSLEGKRSYGTIHIHTLVKGHASYRNRARHFHRRSHRPRRRAIASAAGNVRSRIDDRWW